MMADVELMFTSFCLEKVSELYFLQYCEFLLILRVSSDFRLGCKVLTMQSSGKSFLIAWRIENRFPYPSAVTGSVAWLQPPSVAPQQEVRMVAEAEEVNP